MIYSKYDVMKRCISEMNFPDYRYEQLIKMILHNMFLTFMPCICCRKD